MNYDKDSRPNGVDTTTGEVLAEAMPWIKNITGKTIVIKYGGSAMVDEQLRAEVMADIVLLKIIGVNPVIVHGGGLAISEAMKRFDMPVKFIDGQRVTTDEAMKVVRSVLAGQVNQELVEAMNEHGRVAVGLSGTDYDQPDVFTAGYRTAIVVCAVLFAIGGIVAWLTIRRDVLEPD